MAGQNPEDAHRLFIDAFNAQDVDALVALYEPDAVLCNKAGKPVRGLQAIRQAFEAILSSKPQMKLRTRYAIPLGDLALLRSDWEIRGAEADGIPFEPHRHSSTEVVRRQPDGTWRYVIDHPFGAD